MSKIKTPVSSPNFSELDTEVTKWWKENEIFTKSLNQREGQPDYIFYDGPPFMSGMPHYATLLSSLPKDVVPRYQTMKGKKVERVWGWDCHGLPIENKVETQLGLNGRKEIESHGLTDFIEKCYEWNRLGIENWRWYVDKIGRWADLDNAYRTMDQSFMESVWWAYKQMNDKGLIYKGKRTSLFSTDSSTPVSSFEVSMDPDNYKDTEDLAITVKFELTSESLAKLNKAIKKDFDSIKLLAWTTTPWTIPSNFALAVNPEAKYCLFEDNGEYLVVAESRLEYVAGKDAKAVVKGIASKTLTGLSYKQVYDYLETGENDLKVYQSEAVTTEDGTGILHVAPAFGEEDFKMGEDFGLSFTADIDDSGLLTVGPWTGTYLRDANPQITEDLAANGKLFKQEKYVHRLPFYRYKNPLIYKAQENYFVDVQKFKKQLLKSNEEINWIPNHFKKGRFEYILETAPDWSISRSRYWGTVMPVWRSSKGDEIVIGSRDELMQYVNSSKVRIKKVVLKLGDQNENLESFIESDKAELLFAASQEKLSEVRRNFLGETEAESKVKPLGKNEERAYYLYDGKPLDLHRPYIDSIKFEHNGQEYSRIPETLDVWLDSGSMPFAQFHYPFQSKDKFEQSFPGDFIAEYTGQIRAWFYVLHLVSNALFNQPAFKNVLVTGVLAGNDGRKMSKSYGNYPDPKATLEKYGAEALRLYFLGSTLMSGNDMDFSEDDLKLQIREFLIPYWNIYKYFATYALNHNYQLSKPNSKLAIDKWMFSLTNKTIGEVDTALGEYNIPVAIRQLQSLINETSKWYIRVNRERFANGDKDVLDTLYYTVNKLTLAAAPIVPFITERIYQDLILPLEPNQPESVHLCDYPTAENFDAEVLTQMDFVRQICDIGQSLRTTNALKLRQPLASVQVATKTSLTEWMQELICLELNVKAVTTAEKVSNEAGWVATTAGELSVALDTNLNDELKSEGLYRELVRSVQALRKQSGMEVNDMIILQIAGDDAELDPLLKIFETNIAKLTKATKVSKASAKLATPVKGTSLSVGIERNVPE